MQKIYSRPGGAVISAVVLGCLGFAFASAGWTGDAWFLLFFGLLCTAGAVKLLRDAVSQVPALAFDQSGLQIRTLWTGTATIPWRRVQQMSIEVTVLRYWGIIPIARNETLVVRCEGGFLGSRRLCLSLRTLDLPRGAIDDLLANLQGLHATASETALPPESGLAAGWPDTGASQSSLINEASAFDADAVLARYLARKETGETAPSASHGSDGSRPARPTFGRRSVAH